MTDKADIIKNELNYYKYGKLLVETCTSIMLIVYKHLYNWSPDKSPNRLADHFDDIPIYQTKTVKQLFKASEEIAKIEDMRTDILKMTGFDITFYYKLIQYAINNDKIKPPNDKIWSKNCPQISQGELEHLLFLVKNDRNDFNHKDNKFLNLKDEDLKTFCETLLLRFHSILQQVGIKALIDQTVIDETYNKLEKDVENIRDMKEMSSSDEKPILKIMIEKDLMPGLNELKRCFGAELKSYCPPNFKIKGEIITTKQLLSDVDSQLICIYAESGFGKTSFTKYAQLQLLLTIQSTASDHFSLEIPLRVACRNITGRNVSEFLEDEIPFSRHYASDIISLRKFLDRFNIRWIIDGYDERTAEFSGFFQSLMKNLPKNHQIIITSRLNCRVEIEEMVKEYMQKDMKVSIASIESFRDHQIKNVADNYLGAARAVDFDSAYQTLSYWTKKFIKTPINLSLCLELFEDDPDILVGQLMTRHRLYEKIFDKNIPRLVDRHKGKTDITDKDDLKLCVNDWFHHLCKETARILFTQTTGLHFIESSAKDLKKIALHYGLKGSYCLSTFMDSEKSSAGKIEYFYKHNIEKEVLANLGLMMLNDEELIQILTENASQKSDFEFFLSCNYDGGQFPRVFAVFLKRIDQLQTVKWLMRVKEKRETCFDSLMVNIASWDHPFSLTFHLSSYVTKFFNVLNEYKDLVSFDLKLVVADSKKFLPIMQMFREQGYHKMIKEIDFNYYIWEEPALEEVFKLENLNKVSFCVSCYNYSTSFLSNLGSPNVFLSVQIPPVIPPISSIPLGHIQKSCHAHFSIWRIEDPSKVIRDLLNVIKIFKSVSVDLHFGSSDLTCDLDVILLEQFLSSSVRVLQLRIELIIPSKYPLVLQLLGFPHIEKLKLDLWDNDELTCLSVWKTIFESWKFQNQTEMKDIVLGMIHSAPLNMIYTMLPSQLIGVTTVRVYISQNEWRRTLKSNIPQLKDHKQFKQIRIRWYPDTITSESTSLRSISKSLVDFVSGLTI